MPEFRRDPIIGRWVIIAKERGKRPSDFVIQPERRVGGFCPLCQGNENTTPPEVLAYGPPGRVPNTPGWTVRVVPNKFPALVIEGDLDKQGEGIYDKMNGIGAHEVIVETPDHDQTLAGMPHDHVVQIFHAYRDRMVDLERDQRFRYIMVFKNFGRAAGASLEHSHSQLIALPVVPHRMQEEINGTRKYYDYKERCVYCDIIRQERSQNVRVVCENEGFIAICPYAPLAPFETWVLPKRHASSFPSLDEPGFQALTGVFLETMRRLDRALPRVPYNYMLHTAPLRTPPMEHYHWHIEIVPKLTMIAGFEWGTGFYINPTPPEEAARYLREMEID
ncbi:galactose-1-phosphate uridylyltransferase [Dissulfurirhabdus thermomarina]|uniref:Galactose-1-phosphate uridylyltransferase n=1 Tax=Dissulfurirhabdus thermomarina TaxID=1765737 RepID=A0A6N9TLQ9_DISTH|nr:galactose-1-phosphate uridylyltransferase [Dissulfurirhabdus thermomarina]NDY42165.1 galactose-1-phosphate uridylyltransferase [Dissulfurirhabdus thermomarina]NMX22405.1 galactose-1-phosphate uridylyltransferase [Dissulfurirhabdus thermomarina]